MNNLLFTYLWGVPPFFTPFLPGIRPVFAERSVFEVDQSMGVRGQGFEVRPTIIEGVVVKVVDVHVGGYLADLTVHENRA